MLCGDNNHLTCGKQLSIFKEWYSPGIKSPIFDSLRTVNNHLTELSQVLRKHNADRIEDLLDSLDKIDPNDVRVILDSPFHLETHRKNPHKEGIYICVHCGKPAFQRKAQTLLMTSRCVLSVLKNFSKRFNLCESLFAYSLYKQATHFFSSVHWPRTGGGEWSIILCENS